MLDAEVLDWQLVQASGDGPKPLARDSHAIALSDQSIYMFGGHGRKELEVVEEEEEEVTPPIAYTPIPPLSLYSPCYRARADMRGCRELCRQRMEAPKAIWPQPSPTATHIWSLSLSLSLSLVHFPPCSAL